MQVTHFYSPKGGQGCTVTAGMYATRRSRQHPVLLVDHGEVRDA